MNKMPDSPFVRQATLKTTRLVAGLAIALASPIAIASSASKANAQANQFFQAQRGIRLCATIINLTNANPNHLSLRMAARECSFVEYQRTLCTQVALAQFPPPPDATDRCWGVYINLTPRIRAIGAQLNL